MARPVSDNPRGRTIAVRLTAEEYEMIASAAGSKRGDVSRWARAKLLNAARRTGKNR